MGKILCYVLITLIPILGICQRPQLEWAEQFSTGSVESGYQIKRDYQGNYVMLTAFMGTTIVGGQTYSSLGIPNEWNFVLSKFDGQRNHLWTQQIYCDEILGVGGDLSFPNMGVDGSGNVYLYLCFDGELHVAGSTVSSGGIPDGSGGGNCVIKFSASGTLQWANNIATTTGSGGGSNNMFVSSGGEVVFFNWAYGDLIIDGSSYPTAPNGRTFFVRVHTNGTIDWHTRLSTSDYWYPSDWVSDGSGQALYGYACGGFQNTITFSQSNPITLTSSGGTDAYVSKLQAFSFANVGWTKTILGPPTGDESILKVVGDGTGVYAIGKADGGLLDFGNSVTLNLNGPSLFLGKYSSTGNAIYATNIAKFTTADVSKATLDNTGNLYFAGSFQDSIVFGNGTALHSSGLTDAFIAKVDPTNGAVLWAFSFGGSANDRVNYIDSFGDNEVFAASTFSNVLVLDGNTYTSNGDADALYLKFNGCLVPPITMVSSNGTTLCNGQATVLSVDSLSGATYSWYLNGSLISGQTATSFQATQSGTYEVVASLGGACVDTSNALSLTFSNISFDVITTPPNVSGLCENTSVQLSTSLPFAGYSWSNGTTNGSATIYVPGTYVVTVTDFFGCSGSDSITIAAYAAPSSPGIDVAVNCVLACDTTLAVGSYKWRLNGNIVGGNTQFLDANLYGNGFYTVEITDLHGCKSMSPLTNVSCAVVGVAEPEEMALEVFPNPSSGLVWIRAGNALRGAVDVAVFDALGIQQRSMRIHAVNGVVEQALDLGGLAAGYYVVRVWQRGLGVQRGVILRE